MTDDLDMNDPNNIEGMKHVRGLLEYIGEDVQREGLKDTPARVLSAMAEHFSGYREDPKEHLLKTFEEVEGYDEVVLVSDIDVHSHCEHHMVPFFGMCHIAYIPQNQRIVGISKMVKIVDILSKKLQVQEHLTTGKNYCCVPEAEIDGKVQAGCHLVYGYDRPGLFKKISCFFCATS